MSGRIRSIKPEWLEDEVMSSASSDARVLSIALILMADDYGNGRNQRITNASRVFPPSGDSPEELASSSRRYDEALRELSGMRFAGCYQVDGQNYFAIRNWAKHQKVSHPGKPLVPPPPDGIWKHSGASPESLAKVSGESRESLLPDLIYDQRREGTCAREPAHTREPDPPTVGSEISVGARRFTESLNTEAPDFLQFTEQHREIAKANGLDINHTWLECRDKRRAKGYRCASWEAEFTSWLRTEAKFKRERANRGKAEKSGPPVQRYRILNPSPLPPQRPQSKTDS